MNRNTFTKAYDMIKASGSSYEALTTPFFSEEDGGIVIPTIMKVLPLKAPSKEQLTWPEAMATAAELGQQLPTREEWHEIRRHGETINQILRKHKGDTIASTYFWTCTEFSQYYAWNVIFGSGNTDNNLKYNACYCRPLAAFNL